MGDQLHFSQLRAVDANGEPSPGALARFYVPGTTTPKTVYADSTLTTVRGQPLAADAAGVFPQVYTSGLTKVTVTDADGATLPGYPLDPCGLTAGSGAGAAQITFAPSVAIPETNVQDAVERVQANIATAIEDAGLGVTGTGPALSSFDDTDLASGFYAFTSATPGTRPTGWAGVPGTVILARNTASEAVMYACRAGVDEIAFRRFFGVWQPWVFIAHDGRIATEAQARAGLLDTVYMTPLRAAQAISAQVPALATAAAQWQPIETRAISASVSEVVFDDLDGADSVMLILEDVTASIGGHRAVQVSTDGGSTWLSAGKYLQSSTGTANHIITHANDSAGARTGRCEIHGLSGTFAVKPVIAAAGLATAIVGVKTADEIDAVRVINTTGGDLTGGTVYLFTR